MTSSSVRSLAALAALGAVFTARTAGAQVDINPPRPNVLLVVDTSGSMEYKSGSSDFPACFPDGSQPSERSRWTDVVEVLTGSIQDYRCDAVDRNSTAFRNEYFLSGNPPPDWQYSVQYHRPLSGTCAAGPGTLPTDIFDAGSIAFHEYNSRTTACANFEQSNDGMLDSFLQNIRFGLMTFDTEPDASRGFSGTSLDWASGVEGAWSYYGTTAAEGRPKLCATNLPMEVGARNTAAPPWEGRMVSFGDPTETLAQLEVKNRAIQESLLTTRPYGATPIAGILDDARFFFHEDDADELEFAPKDDSFVEGGCRQQALILVTDGEPNLDLRPYCQNTPGITEDPPGQCPFEKPEEIARDLWNTSPATNRVKTIVIGFALDKVTVDGVERDCSELSEDDLENPAGLCATEADGNKALQVCCTLNRIAFNGSDEENALFASDKETLRSALSKALLSFGSFASRSQPVVGQGSGLGSQTSRHEISGGLPENAEPDLFPGGSLIRTKSTCQDPDGVTDDFVKNVNDSDAGERLLWTVIGETAGTSIRSTRSIRPRLHVNDGAGLYDGAAARARARDLVELVPPAAMSIGDTTCTGLTATQCRDRYLKWNFGLPPAGDDASRCAGKCSLVGQILHGTGKLVGNPTAFVRDESYDVFKNEQAKRPLVLYQPTIDGFLHAFFVDRAPSDEDADVPDPGENNEMWAFMPPAVLPSISTEYPSTRQVLLDDTPVIKDVVAANGDDVDELRFERDSATARAGGGSWRTVLVQGFGAGRPGYFALDVTDPVIDVGDGDSGPRFLWQLTQDSAGNPLFGLRGSTPLITTLFFDDGGTNKEVAVAVLPGGSGGAAIAPPPGDPSCGQRKRVPPYEELPADRQPRDAVNCYATSGKGGRSLTIVRLDNGEIIRTFRRETDEVPADLRDRVIETDIDSPITGQPVAFPSQTGAVADRIFVGDQDGTLWRVDVSNPDPDQWTMTLFFDLYTGKGATVGQPIDTPPILSVDERGNITVAASSGDQEVLTASDDVFTSVWSLTDEFDGESGNHETKVNWFFEFEEGERVTGTMNLFSGILYFSSFKPGNPTEVCALGDSRLWGVHYLNPEEADNPAAGGEARLPPPGEEACLGEDCIQFEDKPSTLIPGVAVGQQLSCGQDTTSFEDPYLGFGQHTSMTSVTPGRFELMYHPSGSGAAGSERVQRRELTSPATTSRIDSWAAIVE